MKKLFLILLLLIPMSVHAKTYELEEFDLSINFNDDWHIFTRDNIVGNKELKTLEINEQDMNDFFNDYNAYLNAINKYYDEFYIIINDTDFNNMSNLNDGQLEDIGNGLMKEIGSEIYEIIRSGGITYIRINFYNEETSAYYIEYFTTVNAKSYSIIFRSNNSSPSDDLVIEVNDIVKSIDIKVDENLKEDNVDQDYFKTEPDTLFPRNFILYGLLVGLVVGTIGEIINKCVNKSK